MKLLDYEQNPIGALKTELMFHMLFIFIISYVSSGFTLLNKLVPDSYWYFQYSYWIIFIIVLCSWCRLSVLISRHLTERFKGLRK